MTMLKTIVVLAAAAVFIAGAAHVSAQLRFDIDISAPVYFGGHSPYGDYYGALAPSIIPIPSVRLAYQFGGGLIDGGIGARAFILIMANMLSPEAFIELNPGPFIFGINLDLFAFLFGEGSAGGYDLTVSELDIAVKLTDWFRFGGGVLVASPGGQGMIFASYVNVRFIIMKRPQKTPEGISR